MAPVAGRPRRVARTRMSLRSSGLRGPFRLRAMRGNVPRPLPAALSCNEVVEGLNLKVEQIEIPLTVDATLADSGGLPRRRRIVEINAVGAAFVLALGR